MLRIGAAMSAGGQAGGGDLIEQGLEQVVVLAVDHGDPRIGPAQAAYQRQTAKARADDDDVGSAVRTFPVGDDGFVCMCGDDAGVFDDLTLHG